MTARFLAQLSADSGLWWVWGEHLTEGGCFVHAPERLPTGSELWLTFIDLGSGVSLAAKARVAGWSTWLGRRTRLRLVFLGFDVEVSTGVQKGAMPQ